MIAPGATIDGKFEVVRRLGEGGFGEVVLARQVAFDRLVAIKVIKDSAADDETLARFEREAKLLSTLSHPNIAMFLGFGVSAGYRYTVMEYVPGETLQEFVEKRQRLTADEAVQVLRQVLSALAQAHAHGIIHRDLKPPNILVDDSGKNIKLIDFGLAHIFDPNAQRLTQEGCAMGTVTFMAPEQCLGQTPDARADLYAAGCIFYFLLTGAPPFTADNAVAVMYKHLNDPVPPLSHGKRGVADELLTRFMAKEPKDRFDNAEQALAELNANAKALSNFVPDATARKQSQVPHADVLFRSNANRNNFITPVAVGGLLLSVGIFLVYPFLIPTPAVTFPVEVPASEVRKLPHAQAEKLLTGRLSAAHDAITKFSQRKKDHQDSTSKRQIADELEYIAALDAQVNNAEHRLVKAQAQMTLAELPWLDSDLQRKNRRYAAQTLRVVACNGFIKDELAASKHLQDLANRFPDDRLVQVEAAEAVFPATRWIKSGYKPQAVRLLTAAPMSPARIPFLRNALIELLQEKDYKTAADLCEYILSEQAKHSVLSSAELMDIREKYSSALNVLWSTAREGADFKTADLVAERALRCLDHGDCLFRIRWVNWLALDYELEGKRKDAQKQYARAYVLADRADDNADKTFALRGLGRLPIGDMQIERGLFFARRALDSARAANSALDVAAVKAEIDFLEKTKAKTPAAQIKGDGIAWQKCWDLVNTKKAAEAVVILAALPVTDDSLLLSLMLANRCAELRDNANATLLAQTCVKGSAKENLLGKAIRDCAEQRWFDSAHALWGEQLARNDVAAATKTLTDADGFFLVPSSPYHHMWCIYHAEVNMRACKWAEAAHWARESASISDQRQDYWMQMWALRDLSIALLKEDKNEEALRAINEAEAVAEHKIAPELKQHPQEKMLSDQLRDSLRMIHESQELLKKRLST